MMITRQETYRLDSRYEQVKHQVYRMLNEYIGAIYHFDDQARELTFSTETLVPACDPAKPNVLLLFSNPHPDSVKTGMFLCPGAGKPHRFWWFMRDAGWFDIVAIDYVPENLKTIFLDGRHKGPFNLFFDCFFDFPSRDPDELVRIFGKDYFHEKILPSARNRFAETLTRQRIDAVVSFNGTITQFITNNDLEGYIGKINDGELLKFSCRTDHSPRVTIPLYQSYPAGYHYVSDIGVKRRRNLTRIREDIYIDTVNSRSMSLEAVMIREPAILFRISKFYSPDLSPAELYEITRGRWKTGANRQKAELAFSIYDHRIIEVYEIAHWFPAGTTFSTREDPAPEDRWEFIGNIAAARYRDKYINKSVAHYFPAGSRNPVRYVNIDG